MTVVLRMAQLDYLALFICINSFDHDHFALSLMVDVLFAVVSVTFLAGILGTLRVKQTLLI